MELTAFNRDDFMYNGLLLPGRAAPQRNQAAHGHVCCQIRDSRGVEIEALLNNQRSEYDGNRKKRVLGGQENLSLEIPNIFREPALLNMMNLIWRRLPFKWVATSAVQKRQKKAASKMKSPGKSPEELSP